MKNSDSPMQLMTAMLFCLLALTGMMVHLLWPVIFAMAIIVGIAETSLFGFHVYSLLMLSLGMYFLTHASRPGMRAIENWTIKLLHNYEDR